MICIIDNGLSGGEARNNVVQRFVYRLDDREEAIRACELLGIAPTSENIELLTSRTVMESDDFLMKDFDGHVGLVRFPLDQLNPRLYRCFNTTDPALLQEREKQFGRYHHGKVVEQS
ncbi:hypothetical protein SAMN05444392_12311 [Seinonella peptonophila]|uniref:Uncharacterized protein n=1 Tax=Seinonella peptonophila TaxID=112248 RepID=A0A1M5BFV8_9BACL|nr:hypothetical protein [Seinonella peptonophila]SHF41305.1 hypothetical protein SAMN05444392_12311 [Seinonella peptonophila]